MRRLLTVLCVFGGCCAPNLWGQERVTLIDGTVVTVRAKVPCEVQGRLKAGVEETSDRPAAKAAPCRVCAACDCHLTGTCACDRAAAERAARVERPRPAAAPVPVAESSDQRLARLRAVGGWTVASNGVLTWMTVGQFLDAGRPVDGLSGPGMTADDLAFLRWRYQGVSAPTYYAPHSPGFSAGFQFRGPFGGGASVGICGPSG